MLLSENMFMNANCLTQIIIIHKYESIPKSYIFYNLNNESIEIWESIWLTRMFKVSGDVNTIVYFDDKIFVIIFLKIFLNNHDDSIPFTLKVQPTAPAPRQIFRKAIKGSAPVGEWKCNFPSF